MHPSEFRTFIENLASDYHGDTYHLISKNCNHFTDDVALRLTGKQIPGWVNRLAKLGKTVKGNLLTTLFLTSLYILLLNLCLLNFSDNLDSSYGKFRFWSF